MPAKTTNSLMTPFAEVNNRAGRGSDRRDRSGGGQDRVSRTGMASYRVVVSAFLVVRNPPGSTGPPRSRPRISTDLGGTSMPSTVVRVHRRVPAAARDQPAVDRKSGHGGDGKGGHEASPEENAVQTGRHRARNRQHDRVVDHLHHRNRGGVGGQGELRSAPDRQP